MLHEVGDWLTAPMKGMEGRPNRMGSFKGYGVVQGHGVEGVVRW